MFHGKVKLRNLSKDIDEVLFFGQRRYYAELYVSNNHEERRVRRCIGPTGSIDLTEMPGTQRAVPAFFRRQFPKLLQNKNSDDGVHVDVVRTY